MNKVLNVSCFNVLWVKIWIISFEQNDTYGEQVRQFETCTHDISTTILCIVMLFKVGELNVPMYSVQ